MTSTVDYCGSGHPLIGPAVLADESQYPIMLQNKNIMSWDRLKYLCDGGLEPSHHSSLAQDINPALITIKDPW